MLQQFAGAPFHTVRIPSTQDAVENPFNPFSQVRLTLPFLPRQRHVGTTFLSMLCLICGRILCVDVGTHGA